MKLSRRTLQILKNFSSINQSVVFSPGNIIKTVVPGNTRDFFGTASTAEEFTTECAIYDIRKFLNCLELFENPDIDFHDNYAVISGGGNVLRYVYTDKSMIDYPDYSRTHTVKEPIAEFKLSAELIKTAIKGAGLLSISEVKIVGRNGELRLEAVSTEAESDNLSLLISDSVESEENFSSLYTISRLALLIEDDYTVRINRKALTEFAGDGGVIYHHGGLIEVL